MPPRFAFWTILIDGKPTAFRARDQQELLPTLNQLKRTNNDVVMKWFARGKLWDSPEAERDASFVPRPPAEKRNRDWRPGGSHKDPRDRFKKKNRPERAWSDKPDLRADRDKLGPPRDTPAGQDRPGARRPWTPKPQGDRKPWTPKPPGDRKPWTSKPPDDRKPWSPKPSGDRKPWTSKPPGDRKPWSSKPPGDRKPWTPKPPGDRKPWTPKPPSDRPWQTKPSGPRAQREPWRKPSGPPRGDRPWKSKPAGGPPRGDRPSTSRPSWPRKPFDKPSGGAHGKKRDDEPPDRG